MMIEKTKKYVNVTTDNYFVTWEKKDGFYKNSQVSLLKDGKETVMLAQNLRSFRIISKKSDIQGWPTDFEILEDSRQKTKIRFIAKIGNIKIIEDWTFTEEPFFELDISCEGESKEAMHLLYGFKMPCMDSIPFNHFCERLVIPAACFGKELHLGARSYLKEYQPLPLLFFEYSPDISLGIFYDPEEDNSILINDEKYTPTINIQSPNQDLFKEKVKKTPLRLHFWVYPGASFGGLVRTARKKLGYNPLKRQKKLEEFAEGLAQYCLKNELVYRDNFGAQLKSNESPGEVRNYVGFGFTSFSPLSALSLYEYALGRGNDENSRIKKLCLDIVRWIKESGIQSKTGAIWDMYFVDKKAFGDFFSEKRFWPWTQAFGARYLLQLQRLCPEIDLVDFHEKLTRWFIKKQQEDGGWPRYIWEDGKVSTETTAANAIVCAYLFDIYNKYGKPEVLKGAIRGVNWVIKEFVNRMNYRGGEEDESVNQEGSFPAGMVIIALCQAFKTLGDKKYMEYAEETGDFLLCWQYVWNISTSKYLTMGTTPCSNHFSKYSHHNFFDYDHTITHSPWETAFNAEAALHLYKFTKKKDWLDFAIGAVNNNQYLQFKEGPLQGGIREGYCGIVDGEWTLTPMVNVLCCSLNLHLAYLLMEYEKAGEYAGNQQSVKRAEG